MREVNDVSGIIVDSAYRLHTQLGPGLLESVYSRVLAQILEARGLSVAREKAVTFEFDGILFDDGLRVDLLVDDQVIVEVKSVEALAPIHAKQLHTYLRLLGLRVGILVNFGALRLNDGLQRIVNARVPNPPQRLEDRTARGPQSTRG